MGWLFQQGTPGNDAIIWPTRVPGRGSPTSDTDTKTGQTVSGLPQAILVTDWIEGTTGAKVEFFTTAEQTLLQTIFIRFEEDGVGLPPYLPFRIEIQEEGLPMPDIWSIRMSCSLGQFDALLIFREAA